MSGDEQLNQNTEALVKIGVQEAKLDILVDDFQESRKKTDKSLDAIFTMLRQSSEQIVKCKDEIEDNIKKGYISKPEGELLKQGLKNDTKSIKLWILSTVGGFSSAGLVLMWLIKIGVFN